MRAFGFLTLAAAAVFSLVGAAPAPTPSAAVVKAASNDAAVVERGVDVKGVVGIFADIQLGLVEPLNQCHYYTPKNATADNLTVTLKAIVDVFADATVELGALKGKSHDIIFAGVDAGVVVTVSVIAQIVANVILSVFLALKVVLSVVADVNILLDVIVSVKLGVTLCGLITAVIGLVDGLLAALVPLVGSLLNIILSLNLKVVAAVLTID